MNLSIVIPAYNEVGEIEHVIERIRGAVAALNIDSELIVVNDGSTDGTGRILEARKDILLLTNERNSGYGFSLKRGIERASNDTVMIIDADNTYPAHEISRLLAISDRYAMVVGRRTHIVYSRFNWLKQRGRDFFDLFCGYLAGARIPDINSGLRVFKKSIVTGFLDELCDRFSFTTSLTLLMFFRRHSVAYIDIDYCLEDVHRTTKVRIFSDGWKTLGLILKAGMRHAPLKLFIPLAALLAVMVFLLKLLLA